MKSNRPLYIIAILLLFVAIRVVGADYTRGIGKYPGSPKENFAPAMLADNAYRNVALHRMAYHSSAYDYNLTAQLLTDGIICKGNVVSMDASTNRGTLPVREREWAIDGGAYSRNILYGSDAYLQYVWHGMAVHADRVKIQATVAYRESEVKEGYAIEALTQDADKKWRVVGGETGKGLPGTASKYKAHSDPNKVTDDDMLPVRRIETEIALNKEKGVFDTFRLQLRMKGAVHWSVTEIKFFKGTEPVTDVLPSSAFSSAWMSAEGGEQWAYIDLGAPTTFDCVNLYWCGKAAQGALQTSDDAANWTTIVSLHGGKTGLETVKCKGRGRYVRVLLRGNKPDERYVLSEIEVFGRGGLTARPHSIAGTNGRKFMLDGGNWRLQRASEVKQDGAHVSSLGFDDSRWITATVPATVLSSYVNIGALPDPNAADNLFYISESFFNADFWYRNTFELPRQMVGKRLFLNFDGINWKADIYLNGNKIDRIEGAFVRGRTDVTRLLHAGTNVLAVRIVKNAHAGAVKEKNEINTDFNGGILGADNPTFHATIGWDWISTIRGRNIGIWNDVYLTREEAVTLRDPLVTTTLNLPDTLATMTPTVRLCNNESHAVKGILRGWIGNIRFEKEVRLPASAEVEESFSPDSFAMLRNRKMHLWWPNGYGAPYLYKAGFSFTIDGAATDSIDYRAGIRQMSYKDAETKLKLYANGRRVVPLGGNWGFSENNLNYRGREYDIAVKYHRDMNFNMIRNWVGQTGDEEFYDACDKYGIMVWQDFWLANPADGPDPNDNRMFMRNAYNYVSRIRSHASIALYCGRNEGFPPETLNKELRQCVEQLHPAILYIQSSADEGVSGHGPYHALPAKEYFERQTGKLHSERGMPNVMTYEGLTRTLRPEKLWPQGDAWGKHDYTMQGAQRGEAFNKIVETAFGTVTDALHFAALAQWENYNGYRAMFESGSHDRMGLLIWMSHPCWPSLTWQTYDYYFEPTAAFFGCKKACETVHIQWNALTHMVEVVNIGACRHEDLTAESRVLNVNGRPLDYRINRLYCGADTTILCNKVDAPQGTEGVYFIDLKLKDAHKKVVSENFYVCSTADGNYRELNNLAKSRLKVSGVWSENSVTLRLKNTSEVPAMMLRLNLKATDGEQILPVCYSDNYIHLMPDEEKKIVISWKEEDLRGQKEKIEISGFNIDTLEHSR